MNSVYLYFLLIIPTITSFFYGKKGAVIGGASVILINIIIGILSKENYVLSTKHMLFVATSLLLISSCIQYYLFTSLDRLSDSISKKNINLSNVLKTVNHDISNCLSIVGGNLLILQEMPSEEGKIISGDLNEIKKSYDSILSISNQLRLLQALESGKETVKVFPTNLKKVVEKSVASHVKDVNTNELSISIDDSLNDLPTVKSYPVYLEQYILSEILDNAIKYSDFPAKIKIYAENSGGNIKLCIQDNGIGIPEDIANGVLIGQQSALRPGVREKKSIGLGLVLATGYMRLFKGNIQFKSVGDDKGTIFCLSFVKTS